MEGLQAKHRKEQRDLQSQITQKKKSASKKTRKTVNDECIRLEQDLKAKQAAEAETLSRGEGNSFSEDAQVITIESTNADDDLLASIAGLSTSATVAAQPTNPDGDGEVESDFPQTRRPNRQKARLARRAAEQEAAATQAAEEAASLPDMKAQEREQMLAAMKRRGLIEKEVAANGHCLYLSVADQMNHLKLPVDEPLPAPSAATPPRDTSTAGTSTAFKAVRKMAAEYISRNPDDFAPFIEEPLADYVVKIKDTGEWGGQLELLALAKSYGIDINVLQADGSVVKVESGQSLNRGSAWLAYYRHGFGLGEHYNSLRTNQAVEPTG